MNVRDILAALRVASDALEEGKPYFDDTIIEAAKATEKAEGSVDDIGALANHLIVFGRGIIERAKLR